MTNTVLLKQYLHNNHLTLKQLAVRLNISSSTLSRKINNKTEFKSIEINRLQKILKLSNTERDIIFFNINVDFKSTEGEKHDI